jgi:hypothetical protein
VNLQDVFDRIEVASDVALNARQQFVTAETDFAAVEEVPAALQRIKTRSQRVSLLQLKTRMLIKVCSIELDIDVERQAPSVDPKDLPSSMSAAAELVERFTADAEEAFDALIHKLGNAINADSSRFFLCMSDLLEYLDPTDGDYWRLVSYTVRTADAYMWTFVDSRIEEPVAVLELLGDIRNQAPKMTEQLKLDQWIAAVLARLYETTADIYAARKGSYRGYLFGDNDAVLVGQAAVKIWQFDPEYKDSRSWFPPSHPWWPFHLPGKPEVLREYTLPTGRVANIVFLPWGVNTIAVGMHDGRLLLFDNQHETAARAFNTGLYPALIKYTGFGLMLYGQAAVGRDGPVRQWLVLSEAGMSLQDEVITERTPTRAELDELESLGRWKRERQLKKLSRCTAIIREGLVPFPEANPGYFTMGQIRQRYLEQHPNRDDGLGGYVPLQQHDDTVLQPAVFTHSGKLRKGKEHGDLVLGLETAKSRLVVHSNRLKSQHSFLVAPSVDHFDVQRGDRLLALAGNGHLYLYGSVVEGDSAVW